MSVLETSSSYRLKQYLLLRLQDLYVMHPYQGQSDVELTLSIGDMLLFERLQTMAGLKGNAKVKQAGFRMGGSENKRSVFPNCLRLVDMEVQTHLLLMKQNSISTRNFGGSYTLITDEAELHQHQKLEKLYISTGAGTKLSEDSRKYVAKNSSISGNRLSKAAVNYGRARAQMEKGRGNLLKGLAIWLAESSVSKDESYLQDVLTKDDTGD
ncbi:unnamed protein product [Dovyalis caffra]|uniref:Uncharacterized protein n=1 Tax=Dovyalis caffra TaxID=77055 RepID=A0AAV1R842_9ROSI|nr:unnamed protein product [Dovyalis caffra]